MLMLQVQVGLSVQHHQVHPQSNQLFWQLLSSAGNLRRELQELRTSSLDLRDVGRDFGFSLCAAPLSDSCPKILEQGDRRLE